MCQCQGGSPGNPAMYADCLSNPMQYQGSCQQYAPQHGNCGGNACQQPGMSCTSNSQCPAYANTGGGANWSGGFANAGDHKWRQHAMRWAKIRGGRGWKKGGKIKRSRKYPDGGMIKSPRGIDTIGKHEDVVRPRRGKGKGCPKGYHMVNCVCSELSSNQSSIWDTMPEIHPDSIQDISVVHEWILGMTDQERAECCSSYHQTVSDCNAGGMAQCPGSSCGASSTQCCPCMFNAWDCSQADNQSIAWGTCMCQYQQTWGCNFMALCCSGGAPPGGGPMGSGKDFSGQGDMTGTRLWGGRRTGGKIKKRGRR